MLKHSVRDENVVYLDPDRAPQPPKLFEIPLDKLDSSQGRKAVARLMRRWERESKLNTFRLLSKRTSLCYKTICNVASEETKWPRFHTMIAIMSGIGFNRVVFYE